MHLPIYPFIFICSHLYLWFPHQIFLDGEGRFVGFVFDCPAHPLSTPFRPILPLRCAVPASTGQGGRPDAVQQQLPHQIVAYHSVQGTHHWRRPGVRRQGFRTGAAYPWRHVFTVRHGRWVRPPIRRVRDVVRGGRWSAFASAASSSASTPPSNGGRLDEGIPLRERIANAAHPLVCLPSPRLLRLPLPPVRSSGRARRPDPLSDTEGNTQAQPPTHRLAPLRECGNDPVYQHHEGFVTTVGRRTERLARTD